MSISTELYLYSTNLVKAFYVASQLFVSSKANSDNITDKYNINQMIGNLQTTTEAMSSHVLNVLEEQKTMKRTMVNLRDVGRSAKRGRNETLAAFYAS